MRGVCVALTLAVVPLGAAAQEPDCSNPLTQRDMNHCAYLAWQAADGDLNDTYGWAREVAAGWEPGAGDALRDAQRAWITYRDAACAAEGWLFHGGSMEPLIVHSCMENLTRRRTEDLRALYEMN